MFTTAYVLAEHKQNTNYMFVTKKYICILKFTLPLTKMTWVCSVGICSTTLWPSNMKADHMRIFNFLALPKLGKYKKPQNSSTHFPLNLKLRMYRTPLSWYEQENLSHPASVLEVCTRVHKILNSALLGLLINSVCRHKGMRCH
jgi:hypothetical protein